ncbi:MAG: DUF3109 family protein [Candidatus Kapaibacteriales bacterium]
MYQIDNILIDGTITSKNFLCDLDNCKGACCTMPGETGAPLAESEIASIEGILDQTLPYLPEKNQKLIREHGFWSKDEDGSLATNVIDNKDCYFVYYEGDIAKCAIEKAYYDGHVSVNDKDFIKPISCHLFPIRVGDFGGEYLYYEEFDVCGPGRELGESKGVKLVSMLKDAIIRAYGENKYEELLSLTKYVDSKKNTTRKLSESITHSNQSTSSETVGG